MDPATVARYYGRGDELHLAFNFSFMYAPWEAAAFRHQVEQFSAELPPEGWPDHVLSSHDARRHASRYDHPQLGDARARLAALMLLTLRGTPFLYYGEEIGMRNSPIPEAAMQDPLARTLGPGFSRDGARTPMQWAPGPGAGFTTGRPWLPLGADADTRNVDAQRSALDSLLNLYREIIALRRATPALHRGHFRSLTVPDQIFAYERHHADGAALVALNFGDAEASAGLPNVQVLGGLRTDQGRRIPNNAADLTLGPCEGAVLLIAG
jgi:alpha-glucosidase